MISPLARRATIGAPKPKRLIDATTRDTGSPSFARAFSVHSLSLASGTHSAAVSNRGACALERFFVDLDCACLPMFPHHSLLHRKPWPSAATHSAHVLVVLAS